ncbi:MAG: hypothetical protein WBE92_08865, partial [Steroidobacteraceae bacterium]
PESAPCLYVEDGRLLLDCTDGQRLAISGVLLDGEPLGAEELGRLRGGAPPGSQQLARLAGGAPVRLDPFHPQGALQNEEAAHPRC